MLPRVRKRAPIAASHSNAAATVDGSAVAARSPSLAGLDSAPVTPEGPAAALLDLAGSRLSLGPAMLTVLCCALWGANAVAVKFTVEDIPPIGCAALRFSMSLVLLAAWCRMEGTRLLPRRDQLLPALALGLMCFFQIALFNWGTDRTLAGRSSVFINVHPLVVAVLAWVWMGEVLGWRGTIGLIAAAAGVATLFEQPGRGSGASLVGDVAVLASGCLLGVMTVVSKRWLRTIRPAQFVLWESAVSVPLFFAYSGAIEGFATYQFTSQAIFGLVYQGVVISGFCFVVWLALLRRYPAGQLSAFGFLTPFFGIGFGWLLRDEALRPSLLVGCALVALGLWFVTRPRRGPASQGARVMERFRRPLPGGHDSSSGGLRSGAAQS